MRKIFTLLALGLLCSYLYAQDAIQPDSRIYSRHSEERVQTWLNVNPTLVEFMNFELVSGYTFIEVSDQKIEDIPFLKDNSGSQVDLENIDFANFNLYNFVYERDFDKSVFYRVGNSNMVIKLYSSNRLAKLFNEGR